MSFADAIGKLQGILSSIGTEETKKTEKKDDVSVNSVFSSALEEVNEEADITGIEIDYSQAADEVAEQLFINKEIHRNAEEAKEWSERVNQELDSANIPESLKDELAPLYAQLCEATDSNQREYISAKIKQKYLEAEANGEDGKKLELLELDLQRYSSYAVKGKVISELNQELAETTNPKMKNKIQTEIEKTYADFAAEESKLFVQSFIRENGLSEEQTAGLSDLYSRLGEATDENSRAQIQAQIQKFCVEQDIDRDGEMMQILNRESQEIAYRQDVSELYDKMLHTNSDKQLDMLGRQFNLMQQEHFIKSDEMEQNIILTQMGLDEDTKQEVLDLYEKFYSSTDESSLALINSKIEKILFDSGVDLNGIDYTSLQSNAINLKMEKEELAVIEQTMNETDPKKLEQLYKQWDEIYSSYEDDFAKMRKKFDDIHNAKDAERLAEMYEQLSNTTNNQDRKAILEQIKEVSQSSEKLKAVISNFKI